MDQNEDVTELDNLIMAFATALRVAGNVDDAEGVESAAASLREEIRRPHAVLHETLTTIRDAADAILTLIEENVPFQPKESPE